MSKVTDTQRPGPGGQTMESSPDLVLLVGELAAKVDQLAAQVQRMTESIAFGGALYEAAIAEGRRREAEERDQAAQAPKPHRPRVCYLQPVATT